MLPWQQPSIDCVISQKRNRVNIFEEGFGIDNPQKTHILPVELCEEDQMQHWCYVVAKDANKVGCIALKTTHGAHLSALKRRIEKLIGYDRIQLVTISRPSAYGEYEPYCFVDTEEEFEKTVVNM